MRPLRNRILLTSVFILLISLAFVPTIVSDKNSSAAQNTSLEYVIQNSEELQREKVAVKGTATARLICTQIACRPENPCCNSCSGDLILESGNNTLNLDFRDSASGCSGDSCNVDCQPLEKDEEYRLEGILGKSNGELVLEVTEHRKL